MSTESISDCPALNVFEGPASIREFLDPARSLPTPLVELPDRLNPFRQDGVRVFGKLACLTPLLNIKYLPVWNMLLEAESSGKLKDVHTIVESSSGNTAFSLAVLSEVFGVEAVTAFVPFDIAPGKLDLLRLAGVQPELKRGVAGEMSGIAEAQSDGKKPGRFCPSQYENEANPAAYEKWFAPQIWEQTRKKLMVFAAGLGTTGTLLGCSRYFRRVSERIRIVGAMCAPNEAVPGVRSRERLKEIDLRWEPAVDAVMEVGTKVSFRMSLRLCRTGLVAGPSSGFALAGLYRFLEEQKAAGTLNSLRNNDDEEIVSVFVCADTPLPYLDKYSTHLDAEDF
jgi:cysteine synthase